MKFELPSCNRNTYMHVTSYICNGCTFPSMKSKIRKKKYHSCFQVIDYLLPTIWKIKYQNPKLKIHRNSIFNFGF